MEKPTIPQKSPIVKEMAAGTYHWCSCGGSKNQPFCDGSHKGTGFAPKAVTLTEAKKVAWCACKHSKNPPFCDGSHHAL
jgi:CDGSH-type Zn-finger protein